MKKLGDVPLDKIYVGLPVICPAIKTLPKKCGKVIRIDNKRIYFEWTDRSPPYITSILINLMKTYCGVYLDPERL